MGISRAFFAVIVSLLAVLLCFAYPVMAEGREVSEGWLLIKATNSCSNSDSVVIQNALSKEEFGLKVGQYLPGLGELIAIGDNSATFKQKRSNILTLLYIFGKSSVSSRSRPLRA